MSDTNLFAPAKAGALELKNRLVMAPLTRNRARAEDDAPFELQAKYYEQRASAGLIITEASQISPQGKGYAWTPGIYSDAQVEGWKKVTDAVHAKGGTIVIQLWHVGRISHPVLQPGGADPVAPSAIAAQSKTFDGTQFIETPQPRALDISEIPGIIEDYRAAAKNAKKAGFDGIEVHAANGYLIDQFFWDGTNQRDDEYGGGDAVARTRFGVDIIKAVRAEVGDDYPVILRFSQWKQQDFEHKIAPTEGELAAFLKPLDEAGVDVFHCSTRRFWEPEFEGSDLNLAGWTKKLTGKPTITVGSVGLSGEFIAAFAGEGSEPTSIDKLLERLNKDEFDMVAIGRALLVDPEWANKIREGRASDLKAFTREAMTELA